MNRLLAWTVLLAFAGACDPADRSVPPSEPTSPATDAPPAMHHLDVEHPTVSQPITPREAIGAKFVQVRVAQVSNPALAAISFTVRYEVEKQMTVLGSFSLYPADHPGTFIVATQGKLKTAGTLRVTMENPDNDTRIRVVIAEINLVSQRK